MKYDLSHHRQTTEAFQYLSDLVGRHALVNIKKVNPKRSLSQNAYLHVLIGGFGAHFGYTLEEAKQVYKEINSSIYIYKKKDRIFYRSSASLTTEEMTKSIDKFRQKSEEAGYPLPSADEREWLIRLENETEKANYYM